MRNISRRELLRRAGIGSIAVLGPLCRSMEVLSAEVSGTENTILAKARGIHQAVLTIDSHVDIEGAHYATKQLDPGVDHPKLRCDLVKMAAGDVDAVFLVVYTGQGPRDAQGYRSVHEKALRRFKAVHRVPRMYADRCELATKPDDVERIVKSGKRAIMIAVENGYPLGTDLANVKKFYDMGARYITLSHNGHNQICDSCAPQAELGDETSEHGGLSPFGRQVVAEMNRLGMMVDVSHTASSTFRDVIESSRAPIIASHSGCKGVFDHPRNLDDRELRALAANGGVIQVVAVGEFLNRPHQTASIKHYIDHIDHAVQTVGVDHVGIGSDFDGGGGVPGFNTHRDSPSVTVELVRLGYSDKDIAKIWGGNLMRVWRAAERLSG